MRRSVVREVKARFFLTKLSVLCEEQGLNRFEIKLLGGLELMVVMENTETTYNVLKDKEHGLRRWLHKLRRGDDFHRMAGRMTWINIIGISILLEGNQNNIAGRVHIHTIYKGLIREELNIKVNGRVHKINVVGGAEDTMDESDMQIDKGVRKDGEDDEESNSEGSGGSSDEEGEDEDEG
ncbi:hypothetical protein Tco_0028607, partial [Tanacetum coccineum]